jgi:hypothetical protein
MTFLKEFGLRVQKEPQTRHRLTKLSLAHTSATQQYLKSPGLGPRTNINKIAGDEAILPLTDESMVDPNGLVSCMVDYVRITTTELK